MGVGELLDAFIAALMVMVRHLLEVRIAVALHLSTCYAYHFYFSLECDQRGSCHADAYMRIVASY